jgi:periplasmic protein TonB
MKAQHSGGIVGGGELLQTRTPEAAMLTVLLESRAAPQRRVGGTVLSTIVHGAAIAAVVALTLPGRGSARSAPDVRIDSIHYVVPATQAPPVSTHSPATTSSSKAPPRPNLPTIDAPTITPTAIPPIDLSLPATTSDRVIIGRHSDVFASGIGTPGIALSSADGVSDAGAVDRAPRIVGRAAEPRYPAPLRAAGISGHVLAEFVVDTLGRIEPGTLRFPELTNPLFGDAVRDALTRYRFAPGEMAGRKVRTRVAVPFEFKVSG